MEKNRVLKPTTIKNYNNQFNKFFNKLNKNYEYLISNYDDVIKLVLELYPNIGSAKTIISTILYHIKNDDKYKNILNYKVAVNNYKYKVANIATKILDDYDNNEKSLKLSENWMKWGDVLKIYKKNYNEIKHILDKPVKIGLELYNNIQSVIILGIYVLHPVRRSEYRLIKINNFNIETDNYILINDKIILNEYKTSNKKGKYEIDLNEYHQLNDLLNKFINLRNVNGVDSDFLFTKINQRDGLDHSSITKRLNNIFNKKISISTLRKIFLTHHFGKTKNIELNKKYMNMTSKMGTSTNTATKIYLKK